jgi:hypothetical protein
MFQTQSDWLHQLQFLNWKCFFQLHNFHVAAQNLSSWVFSHFQHIQALFLREFVGLFWKRALFTISINSQVDNCLNISTGFYDIMTNWKLSALNCYYATNLCVWSNLHWNLICNAKIDTLILVFKNCVFHFAVIKCLWSSYEHKINCDSIFFIFQLSSIETAVRIF